MQFEVEQKFVVDNLDDIRDELVRLGAKIGTPITQLDHYLGHPSRNFAETDEAFRIRQVGPSNYLTYKGPKIDAETKTRRELELQLRDGTDVPGSFAEMFIALGFRSAGMVRKLRQPATINWQDAVVEIALDSVEGLGSFVELEVVAAESAIDAARAALASLAAEMGLTNGERRSYLELLLDQTS